MVEVRKKGKNKGNRGNSSLYHALPKKSIGGKAKVGRKIEVKEVEEIKTPVEGGAKRKTVKKIKVVEVEQTQEKAEDKNDILRNEQEEKNREVGKSRKGKRGEVERNEKSERGSKGGKSEEVGKGGPRRKRWWLRILLIALLIIMIGVGAVMMYFYSLLDQTAKVFVGNPVDLIVGADLKKDGEGRSNILIFGTSEDQGEHDGGLLADSIMVMTMTEEGKRAKTMSLPRDLWVNYEKPCVVGYSGKINATYMCGMAENEGDRQKGVEAFMRKVGEVTGLEMQYYIAVDWTALKEVVDALGGVEVDVYSDDGRGIWDVNMKLKLPKGVSKLDGRKALKLARARNAWGGYGLSRSNFDREINQQRILKAIKKKAFDVGVIADAEKMKKIIRALGENVKTNITMGELRRVIEVMAGGGEEIMSIDLSERFKTGKIGIADVVLPIEATLGDPCDYRGLREFIRQTVQDQKAE